MKKFLLSFAAVLMAVTLSAEKVIDIDLAKYQTIDDNATAVLTDNELTVSYNLGAWGASGVSFALDNLTNVQNTSFEFKGDAAATTWTSFFACLVDANGNRFYNNAADLSIHSESVNLTYREVNICRLMLFGLRLLRQSLIRVLFSWQTHKTPPQQLLLFAM